MSKFIAIEQPVTTADFFRLAIAATFLQSTIMKAVLFHGMGDIRLDKAFARRQAGWVKVELIPGE